MRADGGFRAPTAVVDLDGVFDLPSVAARFLTEFDRDGVLDLGTVVIETDLDGVFRFPSDVASFSAELDRDGVLGLFTAVIEVDRDGGFRFASFMVRFSEDEERDGVLGLLADAVLDGVLGLPSLIRAGVLGLLTAVMEIDLEGVFGLGSFVACDDFLGLLTAVIDTDRDGVLGLPSLLIVGTFVFIDTDRDGVFGLWTTVMDTDLAGVFRLQVQKLGHHKAGHAVMHGSVDENDPLFQEPRKNIIGTFPAVGLFNHHGHEVHIGIDRIFHKCAPFKRISTLSGTYGMETRRKRATLIDSSGNSPRHGSDFSSHK